MRPLAVGLFSLILGSLAFASTCKDSDGGLVPEQFGILNAEIWSDCDSQSKNCQKLSVTERDACIDSKKLLEVYCEGNAPAQKKVQCPQQTTCTKGACT